MANTPHRVIRIPDELWEASRMAALQNSVTISDVVRAALEQYVQATRITTPIEGSK